MTWRFMNKYVMVAVMGIIGFMVSEPIVATAQDCTNQSSSSNSDKQKIIVTWLEVNNTKTGSTPVISVSSEDFWKIFSPLLELLTNETIGTFE